MTDKTLNDYFFSNKATYERIASSSSVAEMLLKIEIFGKKWNQWDWSLLLTVIVQSMLMNALYPENSQDTKFLYDDMLQTIDSSNDLDCVLTNKQVVLSVIHTINQTSCAWMNTHMKHKLCTLLAHVFKKFPSMWNMSWMYAKAPTTADGKKWKKYHRLAKAASVHSSKLLGEYSLQQMFMMAYCRENSDGEDGCEKE